MTPTPDILVLVPARELAELRGQRLPDIEAICRDYTARWLGKDWSLMDDDDEAELRIQAHRWLKCWAAVASTERSPGDQAWEELPSSKESAE